MAEQTSITINDIQTVVNVIDVCTKRGAFEGSEIATIGNLREKFVAFIKANTAQPEETTASQPEAAA
jgi:hypothetical protein